MVLFTWQNDVAPPILLSLVEEKYKIFDIICFVRSCETYCDSISFGLSGKCVGAASHYASILKDLQRFINKFLILSRPLLNVIEKNPVFIPLKSNEETFLPPYNSTGYEMIGRYGKNYITHDEFVFLHLLHKGMTKNDIAATLSIPTQKVESMIMLLTQKTGYRLYLLRPTAIGTSFEIGEYLSSPLWNDTISIVEGRLISHS